MLLEFVELFQMWHHGFQKYILLLLLYSED